MNEATLERLMMDAALGGLNEDVRELLMEHLDENTSNNFVACLSRRALVRVRW